MLSSPEKTREFPGAQHKLKHQPRGSQGTHKLPQLPFPRGLEHRSPLTGGTEFSLSLTSRKKKGFAKNAAFYITVSWCFQQWWEVQGLGPQGCSSAGSGTHRLPVAQLRSQQTQGVVQLQVLTGKKKTQKERLCNSCEGLSVCIVLSCSARIKYALKFRIGIIDCI